MAVFRPFKAVRPIPEYASRVAALPYDVMNSDEAREMVKGNPYSFLHVDKAEVDLPVGSIPKLSTTRRRRISKSSKPTASASRTSRIACTYTVR